MKHSKNCFFLEVERLGYSRENMKKFSKSWGI